jgi:hypothetical protein
MPLPVLLHLSLKHYTDTGLQGRAVRCHSHLIHHDFITGDHLTMSIKRLIENWERQGQLQRKTRAYNIDIPLYDAARIKALASMYASPSEEDLIAQLVSAALDELESQLPYVQGDKVAALDEQGDPIYEDAGPARRLSELTAQFLNDDDQHHQE